MNILDVQDSLKDLPDNALMREMQMPSGTAPQFLVLSELKRRKRMREDFKRREAQDMKTVAEEAVTAAGMPQQGIMQASRAMAPNTNVAQNTGMDTAMPVQPTQAPQPVQRMFDGGITGLERMEADPIGDGRATRIGGRDFVMLPSGVVLDARTQAAASPEETLAVQRKLNAFPGRDPAISDEALAMRVNPSFATDTRDRAVGIGVSDRPAISDISADPLDFIAASTDPDLVTPAAPQMPEMATAPSAIEQMRMGQGLREMAAGAPDRDATLGIAAENFRRGELVRARAQGMPTGTGGAASLSADVLAELGNLGVDPADFANLTEEEQRNILDFEELPDRSIPKTPANPSLLGPRVVGGISDYAAGVFGGRTIGEQEAVDAERLAKQAEFDEYVQGGGFEAAMEGAQFPDISTTPAPADTGTPLEVPAEGITALMPPASSTTPASQAAGAASTSRGGGGGGGGAGFGSLDSRIASMLADREKQVESDKWMALAQTGLALMSSDQPTLGGAIGEAGLAGVGALQKSRQGAQDFETDMLKLQSELDLNRARIAAANRSAAGGGGLSANQLLSRGNDLIKSGQNMLLSAGDNADAVAEAQSLIDAGRNLIRQVTGGPAASGAGAIKLPSAG